MSEWNEEMTIKKLRRSRPVDRQDFILSLCLGKTVLDLGCADWPMTRERYRSGDLLFAKLYGVAKKVTGVDSSPEGVETLHSLGFRNVILGDASELGKLELDFAPEVIVAGELLEHISNEEGFFAGVRGQMSQDTMLVITVPNSYALKRFLRVLTGSELVNKEHVCSFSQANMEELCGRFGLKINDTRYYLAEVENGIKRLVFAPLMFLVEHLCPQVSDHLLFVCTNEIGKGDVGVEIPAGLKETAGQPTGDRSGRPTRIPTLKALSNPCSSPPR